MLGIICAFDHRPSAISMLTCRDDIEHGPRPRSASREFIGLPACRGIVGSKRVYISERHPGIDLGDAPVHAPHVTPFLGWVNPRSLDVCKCTPQVRSEALEYTDVLLE